MNNRSSYNMFSSSNNYSFGQRKKKHTVTDVNDPQYKTFFPSFTTQHNPIKTSPINSQPSFVDKCSNLVSDDNNKQKSNIVDISNWYVAYKPKHNNDNNNIIITNNDDNYDHNMYGNSHECSNIIHNLCHLYETHKANEKSYLGDEIYDRIYLVNEHTESTYTNYDSDTDYNSEDDNNFSEFDFDN